jgi:hypothetical protein
VLASAMRGTIEELRERCNAHVAKHGSIEYGSDYIVMATAV